MSSLTDKQLYIEGANDDNYIKLYYPNAGDPYITIHRYYNSSNDPSVTINQYGITSDNGKQDFSLLNGSLSLTNNDSCEIELNNVDEGDRTWKISGPDYSGNLSFTYTSD